MTDNTPSRDPGDGIIGTVLPIEPLCDKHGIPIEDRTGERLATAFGTTSRTIARWKRAGGIPSAKADALAIRLGLNPIEVWGDTWNHPPPPSQPDAADEPQPAEDPPVPAGDDPLILNQHRDHNAEQLLTRHHTAIDLQAVRVDRIDWAATSERQTRHDESPDTVERYTDALNNGDKFPAVIAMPTATGLALLAGVHRARAHEAASRTWIAAYVLPPIDETTAYLIAIDDNAKHGLTLTNDERATAAEHLINNHGMSQRQAARRCGISENMLNRSISFKIGLRRAHKYGLNGSWKALPPSAAYRLQQATSRMDDHVFAEAVTTARNLNAGSRQCHELAQLIVDADGDEAEAIARLSDYEAEHSGAIRRNGRPVPVFVLRNAARAFLDIDHDAAVDSIPDRDITITLELIGRVGHRSAAIARALSANRKNPNP